MAAKMIRSHRKNLASMKQPGERINSGEQANGKEPNGNTLETKTSHNTTKAHTHTGSRYYKHAFLLVMNSW